MSIKNRAAWIAALDRAASLSRPDDHALFCALVSQVTGKEGDEVFDALIAAIRVRDDLGSYEAVHNAIWRFPSDWLGRALASRLPGLSRRMQRHDQVERFLCPLLGVGARARASFVIAARALPAKDLSTVRAALKRWSDDSDAEDFGGWGTLFVELGGRVAAEDPTPPPPEHWPRDWKAALNNLRGHGGRASFWKTGKPEELDKIVALMSQPLGKGWRELDALTNPLFVSFAKRHWALFVRKVAKLPVAQRACLLEQLARKAPKRAAALRTAIGTMR